MRNFVSLNRPCDLIWRRGGECDFMDRGIAERRGGGAEVSDLDLDVVSRVARLEAIEEIKQLQVNAS
jgi:hypothetical protein